MAITDTCLPVERFAGVSDRPATIATRLNLAVTSIVDAIRGRLRAIEAGDRLRRLSDHQLDDIGLSRADIDRQFPGPLFRDPGDSLHRFQDMVNK